MSRLHTSLHPELTQNIIDRLFKRKIYTALAFVNTSPDFVVKITGMPIGKVWMVRRALLPKYASPHLNGYDCYLQCKNYRPIFTGIKSFDELLDGGLIPGNIYELCGPSPSGKTQILMTLTVNITHSLQQESVLYLDTKCDFYAPRLMEIIRNKGREIKNAEELMDKIKVSKLKNPNPVINYLHHFSKNTSSFRVLIIDSLPAVNFRSLKDENNRGLAHLNLFTNLLHLIAVESKMVIIVSNLLSVWRYRNENGEFCVDQTPFMGKYWRHIPNTRIITKNLVSSGRRTMTIAKSTEYPQGKTVDFQITDGGVQ